ncbi:hypothetical protein IG631_00417 [Alternaria alternata]|nr:hypothetical protein IG631_00417 [Alternaria alternata]
MRRNWIRIAFSRLASSMRFKDVETCGNSIKKCRRCGVPAESGVGLLSAIGASPAELNRSSVA